MKEWRKKCFYYYVLSVDDIVDCGEMTEQLQLQAEQGIIVKVCTRKFRNIQCPVSIQFVLVIDLRHWFYSLLV